MTTADVVVVGSGPVGLSLALGLARAGRSVLVLEKEPSTADHSRAPAIWPRTQEILAELEVIDRFLARGTVLREVELWDADRDRTLLRLPFHELAGETDYPQLLLLPQSDTERLLHRALERERSARIQFSSEVVEVEPPGDETKEVRLACRRDGRLETLRAAFVAGCDGAHSTVRGSIGASFDGATYRTRAALADVLLDSDRGWKFPRLTSRNRLAVTVRLNAPAPSEEGGLWRLILPFPPDEELPLAERIDRAVRDLFSTDRYRTVWKSEFRLHRRVASRFVAGRIVLAGDAAHLNSPVGGQGMNSGIQDASTLTSALLEALDRDEPEVLERYSHRREAITEGVNRFTDRLTRLLLARRGGLVKPTLRATSLAIGLPPLRRRLLRRLAMLDA